jgi:hypothetical protein
VPKDTNRFIVQPLYDLNRNKKEKPQKRTAKRKRELQSMIANIKEKNGCTDCKVSYPYYILDFDHVTGIKVANIASMLDYHSVEDIFKEIEKCEIVCANCHRERTFNRKHRAS